MSTVKVKICGITNLEDAEAAVRFGADSIGFNFYDKSPRYIDARAAGRITALLPVSVLKVGVFVNVSREVIRKTAREARLDAIQLHGDEPFEFAAVLKTELKLPLIRAFKATAALARSGEIDRYIEDSILLDADIADLYGGSGEVADWSIVRRFSESHPRVYLAGGLNPDNVADAIRTANPFAVDACSGLEAEKGKKDHEKLQAFISAARDLK